MRRVALVLALGAALASGAVHAQVVVPEIRVGTPTVRGSLAPAVVVRIVRRHLQEVRYCYERELAMQGADVGGRIVVELVVGANGDVVASQSASSTLGPTLTECIVQAVHRWEFPSLADGGVATVQVPFTLRMPPAPVHHRGLSGR